MNKLIARFCLVLLVMSALLGGNPTRTAPNSDSTGAYNSSPRVEIPIVHAPDVAFPEPEPHIIVTLRVKGIEASASRQSSVSDRLVYKAEVERYIEYYSVEIDKTNIKGLEIAETNIKGIERKYAEPVEERDLTPRELASLQWEFIKNNDKNDKSKHYITRDNIKKEGLTLIVDIEKGNRYRYAHVFCTVMGEGKYILTELQRDIKIENLNVLHELMARNDKSDPIPIRIELNIEEPTEEELKQVKVKIEEFAYQKDNGDTVAKMCVVFDGAELKANKDTVIKKNFIFIQHPAAAKGFGVIDEIKVTAYVEGKEKEAIWRTYSVATW
ncbi:MAG: hypothetical protein LBC09_01940 [Helicobacteraceae bacterium]|jgi:hypothetical protein|nr:hypothetical protein [Helicobacteraceae bacterium]